MAVRKKRANKNRKVSLLYICSVHALEQHSKEKKEHENELGKECEGDKNNFSWNFCFEKLATTFAQTLMNEQMPRARANCVCVVSAFVLNCAVNLFIGNKFNGYVNSHKIYCHHRAHRAEQTYTDTNGI